MTDGNRRGRREVPIPDDKPAKHLAEYLRGLRQASGTPSYRVLAGLVYTKHNALSQYADGRYVGWSCVMRYLDALRQYCTTTGQPDIITESDMVELRRLHEEAKTSRPRRRSTTTERRPNPAMAELQARFNHLWIAHELRREPVQWTDPRIAAWDQLNGLRTLRDLMQQLNELVRIFKPDLEQIRFGRDPLARFTWFRSPVDRIETPEWLVLTGQQPPTLDAILRLVRACGGGEVDCRAWELAWRRLTHGMTNESLAPPDEPPSQSADPPSPSLKVRPTVPKHRAFSGLLNTLFTQRRVY